MQKEKTLHPYKINEKVIIINKDNPFYNKVGSYAGIEASMGYDSSNYQILIEEKTLILCKREEFIRYSGKN